MLSSVRFYIVFMAAAALSGCGASQNLAPNLSSPGAEEAQVSQSIAESPDIVEDNVFAALDETAVGTPQGSGLGAPSSEELIHPLRYWRHIRSIERRFEFAFSDSDSTGRPTRALVVIHRQLRGNFNIAVGDPPVMEADLPGEPRDTTLDIIRKPLGDHWVRRVALERVRDADDGAAERRLHRPWRIVAASGVRITSTIEARPTRISSLNLRSAGLDTTITDPLALRRLHHILKFEPEAEVAITVTTERPDDVVVLMHRDRRFRMRPNGDNTYSGVWRAPLRVGFHHLGVNALAHDTLFDDQAPYSSQAWFLHYVVRGGEPDVALEP